MKVIRFRRRRDEGPYSSEILARSSVGVAVAGAVAVVPGITAVMKLPGTSPKFATGTVIAGGPLVAHVRDLASGEIAFLVGSERLIVRDPDLAVRLHAAAVKSQSGVK